MPRPQFLIDAGSRERRLLCTMTAPQLTQALLGDAMGGLSVGNGSDLIATLLILVLGMALGVGLICLLLVVHFLRAGHNASQRGTRHTEPWPHDRKLPAPFHTTPCRWLAIKSGNCRELSISRCFAGKTNTSSAPVATPMPTFVSSADDSRIG